jgi:AGZA family xanthine/uracil permease-like MFS transporter
LIDRKFVNAGVWSLIGAACAAIGLTHAYQLNGNVVDFLFAANQNPNPSAMTYRSWDMAIGYLMMAVVFFAFAIRFRGRQEIERVAH